MMSILIILSAAMIGIAIGRMTFGKWFNHVSVYSATWCVTLSLYEMRFIQYYPLEARTWMIIATGWLSFLFGSVTVAFARLNRQKQNIQTAVPFGIDDGMQKILKKVLWGLNIITLFAALHSLYIVTKVFGSFTNALVMGNLLYSYRVSEGGGLPGSIPYLSSLVFAAAMLGGHYTARIGKISLAGILPLIIVVMIDFANMGRVDILVAAIIYTSSYFITQKKEVRKGKVFSSKFKKFAMMLVIVMIIAGGAEFIRSIRKPSEGFTGTSKALSKFSKASFITPSIYLYFSAHNGVLDQYLKDGGEQTPIGGHTFSPIYRILEKFGYERTVNTYQVGYKTPVWTNTGTYLRELHGDFGVAGILLGPYIIGLLTSFYWFRYKDHGRYTDLTIATLLFVVVGLSYFTMATRMGAMLVYLISSLTIGSMLDRIKAKQQKQLLPAE